MKISASGKDKSVRVRFPEQLLEKLDDTAAFEGRSRNTEIIKRLSDSLGIRKKSTSKQRSER